MIMNLANEVLSGNRLALARLLTKIENGTADGRAALDELFPHTGRAHLIGVTGAPGTGKSSLVNQLAKGYRNPPDGAEPVKVAIVAVDPSSPFTGGAILGDRIRMRELSGDAGVFIRSMASRGALGGIATTTAGLVQVFDAAGFEIILIETVGAGQAEVDIACLAHTTLVVEAPGMGDDIQAIKAGILEIADVLVINKADRPGVENTEQALRNMLQLAHPTPRIFRHHGIKIQNQPPVPPGTDPELWIPPIQRTIAMDGVGVGDLLKHIAAHRAYLLRTGEWLQRDRLRLETEMDGLIQSKLYARWRLSVPEWFYAEYVQKVLSRQVSPHQAADAMLNGENSS
jgi:LAO/AO transport system kinase